MAFYVDNIHGRKRIPWYDGLKQLTNEALETCRFSPKNKLRKVAAVVFFLALAAVAIALLQIINLSRTDSWIFTMIILCLAAVGMWFLSPQHVPTIEEIKRYRDEHLESFKELVYEFKTQGNLSEDDAERKMTESIYASEYRTDQPQNYFTWKKIGSKKFVKMFLAATEN